MKKLTLNYLKKEFYLDGFLEMLKKKEIKKFKTKGIYPSTLG